MKKFTWLWAGVLLLTRTGLADDVLIDFGSTLEETGDYAYLEAFAPSNAVVTFQVNTNLMDDTWANIGAPQVAAGGMAFHAVSTPGEEVPHAFFRASATTSRPIIVDDGELFSLSISNPTPLYLILVEILEGTGQAAYPLSTNYNPFVDVMPGEYVAPSVEELMDLLGLAAWVTPGDVTDTNYLARLPVVTNATLDRIPFPPGLIGTNSMDDGYAGDPGLPEPDRTGDDPGPDPGTDKTFDDDFAPVEHDFAPEEDPLLANAGRHARLLVRMDVIGNLEVLSALQRPGDAILPDFEGGWPENMLAVVATMATVAAPEGEVLSIRPLRDPFFDHPYGDPEEPEDYLTSSLTTNTTFWMPLPIPEDASDLSAVTVTVYRLTEALETGPVNAAAIQRQASKFQPVATLAGSDIDPILPPKGPVDITIPIDEIWPGSSAPPTLTPIYIAGSKASKFNLVIIGDGFINSTSSQAIFNQWVDQAVFNNTFGSDVNKEILNGVNIYRVNTFSIDDGVTQVDSNGVITTARQTALGYRFSGLWSRLWMEPSPDTYDRINNLIAYTIPEVDLVISVINQPHGGGRANAPYIAIALGNPVNANWGTVAHELGHAFGKLGDEYQCQFGATNPVCPAYLGPEPGAQNHTGKIKWDEVKWREWIPPWRPLPTFFKSAIADDVEDVGLFLGVTRGSEQYWGNIYRPAWQTRMRGGAEMFHPIGYRSTRLGARPYQRFDFRRQVTGPFRSSGNDYLWLLDGRQFREMLPSNRFLGPNDPVTGKYPRDFGVVFSPYLSNIINSFPATSTNELRWVHDNADVMVPGDFDGDGAHDLFLFNAVRWSQPLLGLYRSTDGSSPGFRTRNIYAGELPGWGAMSTGDRFVSGDFNGDGHSDLFVYNGTNWNIPYFAMLKATNDSWGTYLNLVRRYEKFLPQFEMGRHEQLFAGDFNGDGRDDVMFLNQTDWQVVNLMIFKSMGGFLAVADRHFGVITNNATPDGNWVMQRKDQVILGDFNGDGRQDFALFNGTDWNQPVLGIFTSDTNGVVTLRQRYSGSVGALQLSPHDQIIAADVNGDGRDDLVLLNTANWEQGLLCLLRMQPDYSLIPTFQLGGVGSWAFGPEDRIKAMSLNDDDKIDLIIFNKDRLGMLLSEGQRFSLSAHYPDYIQNHRYHVFGYW